MTMLIAIFYFISISPMYVYAAPGNTSFSTAITFPGTAGDENTAKGIISGQSLFY